MPGLFQGLEIGKQALLGHQVSLQTVGHNIANVNTPGYTRQRVRMSTSFPEVSINGPIGTGLLVTDIYHVRDLFLGEQFRRLKEGYLTAMPTNVFATMPGISGFFSRHKFACIAIEN